MNYSKPNNTCYSKCGMLFPFAYYTESCFWMKNTYFPIRQMWLKSIGNNSYIVTYVFDAKPLNTTPVCSYGNAVLEIPSNEKIDNLINASSIGIGDIIKIG
jgi:uncharacterized membrane protein (UPF0127 family)